MSIRGGISLIVRALYPTIMGFGSRLKNSFVTGLVVITPLVVTVYVIDFMRRIAVGFVNPFIRDYGLARYTANIELLAQIIALASVFFVIVVLGYTARWSITQRAIWQISRAVTFIPLVGTLYNSVTQVSNAIVDRSTKYDRAVLVEYPRTGMYMIGLVTGESDPVVETVTGSKTYAVYVPNAPNPVSGRLLLLPEEQIHEVDMSVGQGLRTVITTGMGGSREDLSPIDAPVPLSQQS